MSEDNAKKDVSNQPSTEIEEKVELEKDNIKADSVVASDIKQDSNDGRSILAPKKKGKKVRRQVRKGRAYIKSSYNNTLVMFTDMHGNSLAWSSAGLLGFKGAKKATTYAANQVAMDAHEKVQKYGLKDIEVFVKGVGSGRDAALRALAQKGYNLIGIKDKTPVPHNGCRPKKPRRV